MPTEFARDPPADGRLLVELEQSRWWLHLRPKHWLTPRKYSFQGALGYVRDFVVQGRVLHPAYMQGQRVRIWLKPTDRNLKIGPHALRHVGQVHFKEPASHGYEVSASLLMPESAMSAAATCLTSVWKYLRLSTFDEDDGGASVSEFAFSASRAPEEVASASASTSSAAEL